MSIRQRANIILILVGMVCGFVVQLAFGHGWWLNSFEGVRDVMIALAVMACVVKAGRRPLDYETPALVSLWLGTAIGWWFP